MCCSTILFPAPASTRPRDPAIGQPGDAARSRGNGRRRQERNLRFMTDSSKDGPEGGAPAIMPGAMLGDRAAAIFAAPAKTTKMIESRC